MASHAAPAKLCRRRLGAVAGGRLPLNAAFVVWAFVVWAFVVWAVLVLTSLASSQLAAAAAGRAAS